MLALIGWAKSAQADAEGPALEGATPYQWQRRGDDTVVISVGKNKIMLVVNSREDRQRLKSLDLETLLHRVDSYVTLAEANRRDTTITDEDQIYQISFVNGETRIQVLKNRNGSYQNSRSYDDDDRDYDRQRRSRKSRRGRVVVNLFSFDLGFNNYVQPGGQFPNGTDYDLRPLGSRYFAVGSQLKVPLSGAVKLRTGASLSWYNFMFDGNRRVRGTDQGVAFFRSPEELEKSKIAAVYVNLPVMIEVFGSRSSGRIFGFGVGGYAGYRLASYTKVVYNDGNSIVKPREYDNLSLNNLRYGLAAELRIYRAKLFFNYDLNPLFAANRGPELNAFSFGLRI
ncbi:MAG: PorT family protein [Bernardetiaceae bacterium]|nr:PorT family protein [Bernardetiaceae bacterium]